MDLYAGLYGPDGKRRSGLQVTPLMVDNTLYGCTGFSSVFALDPVTGKEIWRRDTLQRPVLGGHPVCRGLSLYHAATGSGCPTRLLVATVDNHLLALDARTGNACSGFGVNGAVDLAQGLGTFPPGWTHPTSPPTIVNGTAVVGAFVADNQSISVPPGVIRGYDATTGALKWAFDPARPRTRHRCHPGLCTRRQHPMLGRYSVAMRPSKSCLCPNGEWQPRLLW